MPHSKVFTDDDLAVRFAVDERVRQAPRDTAETAAALGRLNMAHAYLTAEDAAEGWQAVLSIHHRRGGAQPPVDELAEQSATHDRYGVVTAANPLAHSSSHGSSSSCAAIRPCATRTSRRGRTRAGPPERPAAQHRHVQGGLCGAAGLPGHPRGRLGWRGGPSAGSARGGNAARAVPPRSLTRDRVVAELPLRTFELLEVPHRKKLAACRAASFTRLISSGNVSLKTRPCLQVEVGSVNSKTIALGGMALLMLGITGAARWQQPVEHRRPPSSTQAIASARRLVQPRGQPPRPARRSAARRATGRRLGERGERHAGGNRGKRGGRSTAPRQRPGRLVGGTLARVAPGGDD